MSVCSFLPYLVFLAPVKELKPFEGGRGASVGLRGSYIDRERDSGNHRESRDGLSRERAGYNNDCNFHQPRK